MEYRQKFLLTIIFNFVIFSIPGFGQLIPQEVISHMMKGINIGNTLEPPLEGGWNNGPLQEYYFDDYEEAGFQCVRIPVRWDQHTSNTPPYTIDESWLDRVEEVVDWGLERDLFIIINAHHEDWFYADYSSHVARFDSIWSQVSNRFQDKSDSLFFEIVNEPTVNGDVGLTVDEINELNSRIIATMRRTNPTRIIIYSGNSWSNLSQLQAAAIPEDDYIMAYYHSYDPYEFGINGEGSLSSSDIQYIKDKFKSAGDWSKENNIPIMISEFGAPVQCNYNDRMYFYALYVEEANKNDVAFLAWDDGGYFRIYKRASREWEDHKDILIYGDPKSPTNLICTPKDSTVTITWLNRTTENDSIIIERKTGDGEFEEIGKLSSDSYYYTDSTLAPGYYFYRVIAEFQDTTDLYSYPLNCYVKPSARFSFNEQPFAIPGKIEIEEFDIGGEGLTYHDLDEINQGNAQSFRISGVDIENCSDVGGGYNIGYIKSGEWLEYTIQVEEAGLYDIEARVASAEATGKFNLKIGSRVILRNFAIINTGGWQNWESITATTLSIEAGEHILRVEMKGNDFNLNWINFEKTTAIDGNLPEIKEFKLNQNYPNPFNPSTTINYSIAQNNLVELNIYNLNGELIKNLVNEKQDIGEYSVNFKVLDLSSGIYFYTLKSGGKTFTKKMMFLK